MNIILYQITPYNELAVTDADLKSLWLNSAFLAREIMVAILSIRYIVDISDCAPPENIESAMDCYPPLFIGGRDQCHCILCKMNLY